jgi:hypothetical protein
MYQKQNDEEIDERIYHTDKIYDIWANEIKEHLGYQAGIFLPIDHGGARELSELQKRLGYNPNFFFYKRIGAKDGRENCLWQSAEFAHGEIRIMHTDERKYLFNYFKSLPKMPIEFVAIVDKDVKRPGAPSLLGGYEFCVRNAPKLNFDYKKILTTVKLDLQGAADIAAIQKGENHLGTLRYFKEHNVDSYFGLLADKLIPIEDEKDQFYLDLFHDYMRSKENESIPKKLMKTIFGSNNENEVEDLLKSRIKQYFSKSAYK